jgi:parallel beta-helix repeat protein
VVLRNNIVIDGEGFVLQGAGGWGIPGVAGLEATSAINLTCSNVTVRNFNILGWEVGILGAYDSNTISNNIITQSSYCISIYADHYNVTGNYLGNSIIGVRVKGNYNSFSENQIMNNYWGFLISSSSGVIIAENKIANNNTALDIDDNSSFQIYLNDFIIGANATQPIVTTIWDAFPGFPSGGTLPSWDNGSEGNYWSDYATKYPNATEIDHTGIGDTPYLIRVNPTVIDRYPLITPVTIQNITIASPSQNPTTPPATPQTKFNGIEIAILIALIVIAALLIIIVALVLRKKQ